MVSIIHLQRDNEDTQTCSEDNECSGMAQSKSLTEFEQLCKNGVKLQHPDVQPGGDLKGVNINAVCYLM